VTPFKSLLVSGVLVVAGCKETSKISAVARLDPPLTVDMLTIRARDDDRGWTWRGSDFRSSLERPTPTTDERETRIKGEIQIFFRLEAKGDTVSEGSVTLPLRNDWRWGVQVISATSDPRDACSDCVGSKAFSLAREYRGPERDSVWLVWGGQALTAEKTENLRPLRPLSETSPGSPGTPRDRRRPRLPVPRTPTARSSASSAVYAHPGLEIRRLW